MNTDKSEKDKFLNFPPDKVKDWVEKQGYSLEMRVARKFRDSGFHVSQFEHFIDQESNSVRPVDVVASLSKNFGDTSLNIRLFIECKYAKTKPWVILVTPQKFDKDVFFSRIIGNHQLFDWKNIPTLQGRLVAKILQSLGKQQKKDLFSVTSVGYIVREVVPDNQDPNRKDIAYEATVQVSKSVEAQDIENEAFYRENISEIENYDSDRATSRPELNPLLSIIIPIVVISGQLFEGYLGENNEPEIKEAEYGYILVPNRRKETDPHAQISLSTVTIVTEHSLDKYICQIKASIEEIFAQTNAIDELVDFENSQIAKPLSQDIDF